VPIISDSKKDIAVDILNNELNIVPMELTRFTTGNCHSVYYVKTKIDEYVLRITSEENKKFYFGSIKWLNELNRLDIPVPNILNHGQYGNVYYALITFIRGQDIGEIYHTLNGSQKHGIVKDLSEIQKKVSALPSSGIYGYDNNSFTTWPKYIESRIERSRRRIIANKVFSSQVCDNVFTIMNNHSDYLSNIEPIAFLDDITTKNVLVHNGKLAGIVDLDCLCYGDPLITVGLTNMALLSMRLDTQYIDYWLNEFHADKTQRKAVAFYTMLFCIDFMGEQGMRFNNDNLVSINQEKIELLNSIYSVLAKDLI